MEKEQKVPSREEIIGRLKADLEIQRLSTELQELRARHIGAQVSEIRAIGMLDEMMRKPDLPTPEQIEEMKKESLNKK